MSLDDESWQMHQKKVLSDLERGHEERKELLRTLQKLQITVAEVRTAASIWGALGGLVIGGVVSLIVTLLAR